MATHCCTHCAPSSVTQTLDEMEFERGLWSSALNGELQRVRTLLSDGRDPNTLDSSGYTPLHYAARNGHKDVCQALISSGACVNAQTRSGRATSLQRAAYCGHADVIRLLLRHGADVTLCDDDGKNALHKACEKTNSEVITILNAANSELKSVSDKRDKLPADYTSDMNIKNLLSDVT